MKEKNIRKIRNRIQNPNRGFRRLFDVFTRSQSIGGILLLVCAVAAIIIANIPSLQAFHDIWDYPFQIAIGSFNKEMSLSLWINDGLMAIFFLMVGLEIKREMMVGELSSIKHATLPIFAALGGMIVPALIFSLCNSGAPTSPGWGIPMATDIAFAIGVMSLLGKRVPMALKVFLTALAIVDDLGAIVVLAIFYPSHGIHTDMLVWVGLVFGLLVLLNTLRVQRVTPYVILGVILWVLTLNSGIHATISGVLLAATIPIKTRINEVRFYTTSKYYLEKFKAAGNSGLNVISNPSQLSIIHQLNSQINRISPLTHRFESGLHGIVTFFIMPLFALANAGVVIDSQALHAIISPLSAGIFFGLLLGKPIGITLFSWLAIKLRLAVLPDNTRWIQMLAMGTAAGIGFTMSIFIDNLAFADPNHVALGKIAILVTSMVAGVAGYLFLRAVTQKPVDRRVYKQKIKK
jgi:NhaA family Na+:H+ antiporter